VAEIVDGEGAGCVGEMGVRGRGGKQAACIPPLDGGGAGAARRRACAGGVSCARCWRGTEDDDAEEKEDTDSVDDEEDFCLDFGRGGNFGTPMFPPLMAVGLNLIAKLLAA